MTNGTGFSYDMTPNELDNFIKTFNIEHSELWLNELSNEADRFPELRAKLTVNRAIDARLLEKVDEARTYRAEQLQKPKIVMAEPVKPQPVKQEPVIATEPQIKGNEKEKYQKEIFTLKGNNRVIQYELELAQKEITSLQDLLSRYKVEEASRTLMIQRLEETTKDALEEVRKYRRKFYNERQKTKKEEFDV